jgi:hypothetical protein
MLLVFSLEGQVVVLPVDLARAHGAGGNCCYMHKHLL